MVAHKCVSCDEEFSDAKRCSGCKAVWYCSTTCQKEHWPFHIFDCKTDKPIDTAYHLARACYSDLVPVDAQTRLDYGFKKAMEMLGGEAETMICGVWIGVIVYNSISPQEVRKWRKEGRLVEGIKRVFEAIPPQNRGAYYPWFLQHQYLLDGKPADEAVVQENVVAFAKKSLLDAWARIGGSPRDIAEEVRDKVAVFPEERQICFTFYTLIVSSTHPHPTQSLWLQFGFVSGDEQALGRNYQGLLRRCTFDEFCAAFETSSIPALFDRYSIPVGILESRLFRDVMAGTPRVNKSVWHLKQYIDILICSPSDELPKLVPSAWLDYGFANCRNASDRKLLDDIYKKLFTQTHADPLDLHAACIQGKLLEYMKGFVKLVPNTTEYTRLLKNPYPLPQL